MTIKHYIFIILLFCTGSLLAQDVRFTASVSKSQVGTGEQFEVTFSLNSNGDRFNPPNFSGFEVLSGPNESTSMTSINGNMSSSVSVSYVLVATREGTFTIGPASAVVNGKQLTTNPIKIKVVKGQPVQQNSAQAQGGQDNDIAPAASGDLSKDLFIKASVDKTNVYLGEQINVSYKLYTRVALVANNLDKAPELNGFWSQDVKSDQQNVAWKEEIYKGARYKVAEIKQTILSRSVRAI